jgi:hypothetical protein
MRSESALPDCCPRRQWRTLRNLEHQKEYLAEHGSRDIQLTPHSYDTAAVAPAARA